MSPDIEDTVRVGRDYVVTLHDYEPQNSHATCLAFKSGQLIHVLNRDPSGWWDGELDDGTRGWFPSNFVAARDQHLLDEEPTFVSGNLQWERKTHHSLVDARPCP